MYKRIMVAIDSSPTAGKALAEAVALAKNSGAALCVIHAEDESLLEQHGMGIGTFIDVDKAEAAIRSAGQKLLADAVATAAAAGVTAEQRLIESGKKRVPDLVVASAGEWQADLLVVGSHGRRGVERLIVGSVAEKLVRAATISLLIVRGEAA
jgi:nucleotide-binding universal stress UspA family protein